MVTPDEIRDLRLSMKLTRSQFAEYLGVTYATVSYWERGKQNMQSATWQALRSGLIIHKSSPSPDLIRRARRLAKLRQREASRLLSTHYGYWEHWENGVSAMPPAKWALFLRLVKLPPNFSLDYDPLATTRGAFRGLR